MSCHILLRHGQSESNVGLTYHFDSNLTKRGQLQADDAVLCVKDAMGLKWSQMDHTFLGFTSPYLRALKTAYPLHNLLKLPIKVEQRIGENPNENVEYSTLPHRANDFQSYDWSSFPAEGINVEKRTKKDHMEDLHDFVKGIPQQAIIISHMTTIKDLASILTNTDLSLAEVPNCSITLIRDGKLEFIGVR